MEFKNIFARGVVDKDNDERFVKPDVLVDAENIAIVTSDSAEKGVLKNVLGNIKRSDYNFAGAKTIGVGRNDNKNLIYNFISATNFDYIVEFDANDNSSEIVLQSTVGTRLNFNPNKRILNVDVITNEDGEGDLLAWSGDDNEPRIINIERAKGWGIDGFTAEEIKLIKAPPVYPPEVTLNNTLSTEENYMAEKFLSFAYRYRYKDGYYSAISSWQEWSFAPGRFRLDFGSFENLGMINIFNQAEIEINTGSREVDGVSIVFRESNMRTIYEIDLFIKEDEGWADNTLQTIIFNNSKQYKALEEIEFFHSFDNVPLKALAQTVVGSRLVFANYTENRDLIDVNDDKCIMDFEVGFDAIDFTSFNVPVSASTLDSGLEVGVTIPNGVLTYDFTDVGLNAGAVIYLTFYIQSTVNSSIFNQTYNFLIEDDYVNISALVADTANGFQTQLETYFSEYFKTITLQIPDDGTISDFIGFQIVDVTTNGFSVNLPQVEYTIDNGVDPPTQEYEYFDNVTSLGAVDTSGSKKSMHSYRNYEVGLIIRDLECRKTTVLTSNTNTLFIPIANSVTQNVLTVTFDPSMLPPVWGHTYKFVIKEIVRTYEEIYASIFYVDTVYRWIKLDGGNKNKVKEGDLLLVKKDIGGALSTPIKTKVIEIKEQPFDFIPFNKDRNGNFIYEQAGLYMKIKPEGFTIDYDQDDFLTAVNSSNALNGRPYIFLGGYPGSFVQYSIFNTPDPANPGQNLDVPIKQGSTIYIRLHSNGRGGDDVFERNFIANADYESFEEYFDTELSAIVWQAPSGNIFEVDVVRGNLAFSPEAGIFLIPNASPTGFIYLFVRGTIAGNGTARKGYVDAQIQLRNVDGFFIFENTGEELIDTVFYETPDVFTITDNQYETLVHTLSKTFNCYVMGNGGESYQIRGDWNEKYVSIDWNPTDVSADEYRQINRKSDITYSETFNSNTNLNKLNTFNLALANFKDDIEKKYGAIIQMQGFDTNLEVYQEDKVSVVYYGKDLLFNADGTTNLTGIPQVLGQQVTLDGEYGTQYSDSFDYYGFNRYVADPKRGVIIKKANNGLFPISSQLMEFYFRSLFRDNAIVQINGKFDQFNGVYIINIQYAEPDSEELQYVTWLYSDKYNGWLTRHTFNPEDMTRLNGQFYSFKNGEVYQHNQAGTTGDNYNIFYGESFPSTFAFNFSQEPSARKNFKTISIEGNDAWETTLKTDFDNGFINAADFVREEGVWRGYQRVSNDTVDTSLLSVQGIGSPTISGLVLTFTVDIQNTVSVGDNVLNASMQLVGTIQDMTSRTLTLDSVNNIVDGDFVMASKNQSVEIGSLLGYYERVDMSLEKNTLTEVFAVNAEVAKSFM